MVAPMLTKDAVAPLVGAWIEIAVKLILNSFQNVAPLVGAWIEIFLYLHIFVSALQSLPSWERGLKFL